MKPLEKDLENQCVKYAARFGCKAIKLVDIGRKGFPDRSILCPSGKAFFVEFKRIGGKVSKSQIEYHAAIVDLGFDVWIVDNFTRFKKILEGYL